jgi:NADH dehydrogenase
MKRPHVVILGGGFGGLHAALSLKNAPVQVTLIDRRNFHLFQPLLYQVATGGLSPGNIASPLRSLLKHQKNTRVLLAEVTGFDVASRRMILRDGQVEYDTLIVAGGSSHHYFGNDGWKKFAPSLKTIEDAIKIRRRILMAFEAAERETAPDKIRAWLTFIVVGGGPTGVELAGALGEIANDTLKGGFRSINPADAKIFLLEGVDRVLPPYPPELSARADASLRRLGVTVRTSTIVTDVQSEFVTLRHGDQSETIATRTVLWAAGVRASSLASALAKGTGAKLDRSGRIIVGPDLSLPGYPEIFIVGDMAHLVHQTGGPLPAVAPVAMQEGRYVAKLVRLRLHGKRVSPFRYKDFGKMATIGRVSAVVELGRFRFWGFFAWLIWLFVHLLYIAGYEKRLLILIQWTWYYFTRNRAARLIVGDST